MPKSKTADKDLILSFISVRQSLGFLGLALPTVLLLYARISGTGMHPSISEFYHTPMGDVLVGILAAIGIFLITYRGYTARPWLYFTDREVSVAAGLAVIGVALLPVHPDNAWALCLGDTGLGRCAQFETGIDPVTGSYRHPSVLHLGSAAFFFLCLAYFCLVLFPMGGKRSITGGPALSREHLTYYLCGGAILLSLAMLLRFFLADPEDQLRMTENAYVFIWEAVGVYAFAISWLTKGKFLRQPFGRQRQSK